MDESFPIISVSPGAAESEEAMGTKFKFWYRDDALGDCLFKLCRENTGEDWSEKMAAELAELLGLPHARYELATWDDQRGVVSLQMLPSNTDLLHGNDILAAIASNYPRNQGYNLSQHT
ncbi:MAG: hypothetical protein HC824_17435 [Synechococcales cyanobacterium RM1_1_8]|nr:hypothetical protein [Synechococcales cyanobacterium RM1_1_8]